ncbi:hypothetical protein BU24DRAFT_478936 [Aaosphaeria arxii CBS 175.79]|uniref:Uncharacterized protein n=1 Tax=Aaosphaeria arxii CBS 175.79 TaxID=1450172 RepID=A0A6A5XXX5_9PLEO|nr:uncharacterized protein BU24DRAFT_478936 [Aaosphaeria arxii CBS 175.79]KAF2017773.1 hypothetical protein BU24DRAFT_478936 [Aaosphaeria arxii CBS 175.79]
MSDLTIDPTSPIKGKSSPRKYRKVRSIGTASIDISPTQRELLNLPSPYHDDTPATIAGPAGNDPTIPSILSSSTPAQNVDKHPKLTNLTRTITSFFNRTLYSKLTQNETDIENNPGLTQGDKDNSTYHSDSSSSTTTPTSHKTNKKPKKRTHHKPHWSDYEETPSDRWSAVIFLLLLLSILFNLFLVFNGPPNGIPRHPKPKDNPLPHAGFHFKERGKNYTCYETQTTTFEANYEYSNTFNAYDHLWRELQGKSHGTVYTSINRPDGEVRRAGLAMFHQLDCLAKIRAVVQGLQNGGTDTEDVGEHHGYWPHCFDYLRRVIECNADDSLEVSRVVGGRWVVEGFGSMKECRDNKWLYDVTDCGEKGCEGKAFYHSEEELRKIHKTEEEEVEKARKHD